MATLRSTLGSGPVSDMEVVERYTSSDFGSDCGHLLLRFSSSGNY
jgi:hypothetical protein